MDKKILTKRIVIAGCRDYNDYTNAKFFIDNCLKEIRKNGNIIILSGCCSGADKIGERYAEENGFKIEKHPALWNKYGRSAEPKRNKAMAQIADLIICFWDGKSRGTKSMIEYAKVFNKPINIKMI